MYALTTETISTNHTCDHITSTETTWSTCEIERVETSGDIVCKQEATVTPVTSPHTWTCQKTLTYQSGTLISEEYDDPTCPDETKQPQCSVNHPIVTPDPAYSILSLNM